jgi:pimeloyl-ACP methyl ester carboxylesterase
VANDTSAQGIACASVRRLRPTRRLRPAGTWLRAGLCLALALLSSCRAPLGVDEPGADAVRAELEASALTGDATTASTRQALAMLGLQQLWDDDPEAALVRMRAVALEERDRNLWFALAELHFVRARDTDDPRHELAAVVCAYWYLTSTHPDGEADPFDRRFRVACDLYNRSLVHALREPHEDQLRFEPGVFELPGGSIDIHLDRSQLPWDPGLITRVVPADELSVRGFDVRIRDSGLGAPLVGIGENRDAGTPQGQYLPPRLSISATAFLRVDDAPEAWDDGSLGASLEVYAESEQRSVEVNGRTIPLEADLTAPLAYSLEGSRVWDFELAGFMGEILDFHTGMFMLRPYVPGRIPVVLVHGTASSPARWAPLFNGLLADPVVRSRCQFWFFTYSTGNPVAYSGRLLREALSDIVTAQDPEGRDTALQQMVVIGHSQGGLLTDMTATTTGDAVWNAIAGRPLDDFELEPAERELLEKSLFWERVPQVTRVIFVATPHQGAFLAGSWIGSLARRLIGLPRQLGGTIADVVTRNREKFPPELRDKVPTAVDNMTPDNPFLMALAALPIDPAVRSHSIIAVDQDGPVEEGDDGVVAYTSAHLQKVDSEFVVRAGHSCQADPLVIREVRRILRAHVAAWDAARGAGGRGEAPARVPGSATGPAPEAGPVEPRR